MLDAKTGMLLWASETLTLALLLGTLWLHRPARRHNIYFAAGFAATSAGTVMVALRGDIPNFLSIEVGNTLALSAFSFWLAGLLSFEQRKTAGWIAIPPLLWVAGMLIGPVRENMVPRILLYHICAATGYFMLAGILLASKARASFSRKVLAATFIVQAFCGALVASIVIPVNAAAPNAIPLTAALAFSGILGFTIIVMMSAKIIMEDTETRLHRLAMTDHLTGVLNRRGLLEEFEHIKKGRPAPAVTWRWRCSTSTISRRSTTNTAISRETRCLCIFAIWRSGSSVSAACSSGWAEKNSRSSPKWKAPPAP